MLKPTDSIGRLILGPKDRIALAQSLEILSKYIEINYSRCNIDVEITDETLPSD